ncbi:RNA polymerase II C-terminal domain phosphatase-like 5 [Brassica napus]|uniref:RNA polymerase II C-terminal domain phosphatase-like 5 n=1 Tax=Brassica napus TaxID=3708 RepID=UPI0020789508|nr:RNA polymerase II C-terminal domain phosphatase-like 5 [Brassica napus]
MLDLDQTLLHYVPVSQLSDKEKYLMEEPESRVDLLRFNEENPEHMIKLRPFLREFLKEANKLFRMHVYTMGTYGYARYVLSVIDPGKRYFGNRVITREKSPHKKTLDRISADQRRVVIVDDNPSAWPQHKPNLLQRRRATSVEAMEHCLMFSNSFKKLTQDSNKKRILTT